MQEYSRDNPVYTKDVYACADPRHRLRVRVISEFAWHSLFAHNLFIRPSAAELRGFEPDFTVIALPSVKAKESVSAPMAQVRGSRHADRPPPVDPRAASVDATLSEAWSAPPPGMDPMDHDDDGMPTEQQRMKARIGLDLRQDRDIRAKIEEPLQHLLRIADRDGDADLRKALIEGREHLGHVIGADGPDLQMPGGEIAHRAEQIGGFRLRAEQALRDPEEIGAELAKPDLAAVAMQQLDAEIALERADLGAEGRLAEPEGGGSGGKAAMSGDGVKGAEL